MAVRALARRTTVPSDAEAAENAGTRARILEAALDVFAEYGFEGTSTREICKRADVNVAALNYHWGSKESLWLAVCDAVARQVMRVTRDCLETAQPVEVAVPRLIGTIFDAMVADPRPVRIGQWASLQADSMDFPSVFQTFDPWFRLAVKYFTHLKEERRIRDVDVEVLLSTFYGQFAQALIDQPSQRQYFGYDLREPAHAARVRKCLIDTAMTLLGLEASAAPPAPARQSRALQSVPPHKPRSKPSSRKERKS